MTVDSKLRDELADFMRSEVACRGSWEAEAEGVLEWLAEHTPKPEWVPLEARVLRVTDQRKGTVWGSRLSLKTVWDDAVGGMVDRRVQVLTVRADDGPAFDFTARADKVVVL